LKIDLKIFKKF